MIQNATIYRIEPGWTQPLDIVNDALATQRFLPCAASQERAAGWMEPRGEAHGPLVESVSGQWLLTWMTESKSVPAAVIKRKLAERCAQIEQNTGRKPGKKEKKELKEDLLHELLPLAFSRESKVKVWIDPKALRLVVNATGTGSSDEIVTALVKCLDGFAVAPVHTRREPAAAMAEWLSTQEPPDGITIDRECELRATDESKAIVRYAKHALDIEEIRGHIAAGKRPTRLALTWQDRVSFVLTEGMQIRKIVFLEGTVDKSDGPAADNFDADVTIATGELSQLLPELIEALGGEMQLGEGAPGSSGDTGASSTDATDSADQADEEAVF